MNKYTELFRWWFLWGVKFLFALVTFYAVFTKISGKRPSSSIDIIYCTGVKWFDLIRALTILFGFFVFFGVICGLIAVALKKIRDDELFKLWR